MGINLHRTAEIGVKQENEWRKKPQAVSNFLETGIAIHMDSQSFVERFLPRVKSYEDGLPVANPDFIEASGDLYNRMFHRTGESFHFGVAEGLHQAHKAITRSLGADSFAAEALAALIEQRSQRL